MDNSNLTFIPLDSKNYRTLPDNKVSLYISKSAKQVSFPAGVSKKVNEGGYNYLKVGKNKYCPEIYFVFCKEQEPDTVFVGADKNRITISVRDIAEAVIKVLKLEEKTQILNLSSNLSNSENYMTFKITK